ncbi:MAG: RNA methyltransferase [Aeriscardovia sp.]|nr:RNA methyltransferase [Aeriscardovia sp.]
MPLSEQVMDNPKADRVRKLADLLTKRGQRKAGKFLVEGPQSVREAVAMDPAIVTDVYYDPNACADPAIPQAALDAGLYVHQASPAVMRRVSENAQGIVASARIDALDAARQAALRRLNDAAAGFSRAGSGSMPGRVPLIAACWQVRDPGNEGTIIRTADAAGCSLVVLVDDCVDPLNPKVIRSTAGSLFHIPVLRLTEDEFFDWAAQRSTAVWAADIHGIPGSSPVDVADLAFDTSHSETSSAVAGSAIDGRHVTSATAASRALLASMVSGETNASLAVLFGNEARGLPIKTVERADGSIIIPLYGCAESLNLASSAAILLYTLSMLLHRR